MAANGNDNDLRRIIRGIYTGNEIPELHRHDIPAFGIVERVLPAVTNLEIARSITVIPARLFFDHPNLVELDCHKNIKKIESKSFLGCPRLKRVFMREVEEVETYAFGECESLDYVECIKLEKVGDFAFDGCISLRGMDLPSARIVDVWAFAYCETLEKVTFGPSLEKIKMRAFESCPSLKQITLPLKNGLFPHDNTFSGCKNLMRVTLVEKGVLEDTVNALLLDGWKNDMRRVIDQINHDLPDANAGDGEESVYEGEKTMVIRRWISLVLSSVIHYKKQHRMLLDEEVTPTLQDVLPNDIVLRNVLPFLELPFHTFHGEEDEGRE